MRSGSCAIAALSLCLAYSADAQSGAMPARALIVAHADSLAAAFVAEPQAPGVSIAIVRAGHDTLVFKGYGRSDIENDVAATSVTVYRIGSVTKQFTSSAVMRLVERGSVKLDDSIGTYLPALPVAWKRATVRQILSHTSGIPSYTGLGASWVRRWGENMPPDTLVALTARDTMDFAPGTKYKYDNTGYVVLGMLIEKLTHSSYAAYLDSTIFKPLGLVATRYCDAAPIIPHRAQGYSRDGKEFINTPYLHMSQPFAAGALCSTVGDLARWNHLLATGQVVSESSLHAMTTPQGPAAASHYGFGLAHDTFSNHSRIQHSGGIHGFASFNEYFPADSLSITVLANSDESLPGALADKIARFIFGPIRLEAATRAILVGDYSTTAPDGSAFTITLRSSGDGMTAQGTNQPMFPLIYDGNDTFVASFDPTLLMQVIVEKGHATRMVLHQHGSILDFQRVR